MKKLLLAGAAALAMMCVTAMAGAYDVEFGKFPAEIYRGRPHLPDFNGRDRQFKYMRTRITAAARNGAAFSGKYAVVDAGCGTGCHVVFVVDVSTGQVSSFPLGGEDNMYLSMKYRADSRLLIAQYQDQNDDCQQEAMIWTGSEFKRSGPKKVDAGIACQDPI